MQKFRSTNPANKQVGRESKRYFRVHGVTKREFEINLLRGCFLDRPLWRLQAIIYPLIFSWKDTSLIVPVSTQVYKWVIVAGTSHNTLQGWRTTDAIQKGDKEPVSAFPRVSDCTQATCRGSGNKIDFC